MLDEQVGVDTGTGRGGASTAAVPKTTDSNSLADSVERSMGSSQAGSVARSVGNSLAVSVERSMGISLAGSVAESVEDSLAGSRASMLLVSSIFFVFGCSVGLNIMCIFFSVFCMLLCVLCSLAS